MTTSKEKTLLISTIVHKPMYVLSFLFEDIDEQGEPKQSVCFFPEVRKGYTYLELGQMAQMQHLPPRLFNTKRAARCALTVWRKGPHVRKLYEYNSSCLDELDSMMEANGTEPWENYGGDRSKDEVQVSATFLTSCFIKDKEDVEDKAE